MNKFKGSISKIIFQSDNNYFVMIFKVRENDLDKKYNNHSITVTGYLYDIEEGMDLELVGIIKEHNKYGEQLNISSYNRVVPEDKNSIIQFLSSNLFKGIGESKATKIYETLGDNTINLIKENPSILDDFTFLTDKNKLVIKTKLDELKNGSDTILKLTELGFNLEDATLIYKYYKEETLDKINNNIYNLFYDLDLSFNKIDKVFKKNNKKLDDKNRVKAGIIYTMMVLAFEKGDTYSYLEEIESNLKIIINYEIEHDYFENLIEELIKELKIINIDNNYQLIDYYEADNNIVKRLTYLNNKSDLVYKQNKLEKTLKKYETLYKIEYDLKQKEAITNSFLKNLLIITGGPGTGKTTIIKTIVSMYKEIFKLDSSNLDDIALLAPTGRASKRIMEATNFKASTIHRFLKWNKDTNKFQINEYNKSQVKLVIIDEFSMVDTLLFSSLLNGLRYDTKLILVGDMDQLPSVSPGEVLKDLIESEVLPIVKLDYIYRQKDSNIINLAYEINQSHVDYTNFNKSIDLMFYQANSMNLKENLIKILSDFKHIDYHDYQIMAPMYKTLNGINNLNKIMQELLNPKSNNKKELLVYDTIYREGDKVLQLMNMPDENIYNGDIGVIIEIDSLKKEITIDFDSNIVTFTSNNFQNFTLGYVISIHKAQGSEFKTVIIPFLNEYNRMLYKKLIYTAVTRTKEKLILIGEVDAFEKAIKNNRIDNRKTNLSLKIKARYE